MKSYQYRLCFPNISTCCCSYCFFLPFYSSTFIILNIFLILYLFPSGLQSLWLCYCVLKETRTSTPHLPVVWTSKCAVWDGSARSCHPKCWYLNQHKEGHMIQLGVWGHIYAWEVGAVGWGTTCWVSENSAEGLWGSSLALCHVLRRHNELHYNYNTGWTQKEQNRYLSRGWRGLSHWDFGPQSMVIHTL